MTVSEIGHYPTDWKIDRIDSVFDIQQGKQVSKKNRVGDNQRPFLRTKNIFWNRLDIAELDQMNFTEMEESRLALLPDDLLVCEGGSIGRTALWRGEIGNCYYQNHLHRLRSLNGRVDPQFAVYWFWYAFDIGKLYFGRGNVTTIPNLSRSKLAELPIAVPPLSEQKKIANVLSTVQRAIEAQERIIQTTTELKKALMYKLFTEGTRGEPQKQTEIGPVPESWEKVCIRDVAAVKGGKRIPKSKKLIEEDTGYPYLRVTDFRDFSVDASDLRFLSEDVAEKISRYIIHKNNVFISIAGSTGITGMVPEQLDGANLTENAVRLIIADENTLLPRFLMYWLASERYCTLAFPTTASSGRAS